MTTSSLRKDPFFVTLRKLELIASLTGTLPDTYSRQHMDPSGLSFLIELAKGTQRQVGRDKDVFGKVYEYCLRQFALKEGKGEFYI